MSGLAFSLPSLAELVSAGGFVSVILERSWVRGRLNGTVRGVTGAFSAGVTCFVSLQWLT